jgi:hypothetical protein
MLPLLAWLWLSAFASPCSMAAATGSPGGAPYAAGHGHCPHCPYMLGTGPHAGHGHCPHCPDAPGSFAATHINCSTLSDLSSDNGRDAAWLKWDDLPALAGPAAVPASFRRPATFVAVRGSPPGIPIALNLRYCVFLN